MKLIITESKINRIVTKWLDQEYGKLRKYSGNSTYRYIHYKDNDGLTIFRFNLNTGMVTIINPDLEMAQDGFEHTACKYYKQSDIPQQDENKELLDLLKKVLK